MPAAPALPQRCVRAEGRILHPDATRRDATLRRSDRQRHDPERAQRVHADQRRVDQVGERHARAETKQHARQREVQHVGIQARHRQCGEQAPVRCQVAAQDERKEWQRDGQNGLHRTGSIARRG